jgi:hypothetical protein
VIGYKNEVFYNEKGKENLVGSVLWRDGVVRIFGVR